MTQRYVEMFRNLFKEKNRKKTLQTNILGEISSSEDETEKTNTWARCGICNKKINSDQHSWNKCRNNQQKYIPKPQKNKKSTEFIGPVAANWQTTHKKN